MARSIWAVTKLSDGGISALNTIDSSKVFAAHADSWQAHGRLWEPYGGGTAEFGGWRLMASGLPYAYFNAACVTDPALADKNIVRARAWYRKRNLSWGAIVPSGSSWPHGRHFRTQRLMATVPSSFSIAPAPSGLVLRRAGSGDVETVASIDSGAFGSPVAVSRAWLEPLCISAEVELAIGELDGQPVATGYATRCDGDAGPSLYVGGIGVLPAVRRRGIAAALLTWLLTSGFEDGTWFAHLQTDSANAARLYSKLGFEEFNGIDIYADL